MEKEMPANESRREMITQLRERARQQRRRRRLLAAAIAVSAIAVVSGIGFAAVSGHLKACAGCCYSRFP
jgi:disulfide bond formation protein DsbB